MTSPRVILGQDWTGEFLLGVQAFHVPAEASNPLLLPRALSFQLGERWLSFRSDPEEPLLHVVAGRAPPEPSLTAVDCAARDPFGRFMNCPLYSWWLLENELGSVDGMLLAFDSQNGVLILAQPAGLHVLAASRPA